MREGSLSIWRALLANAIVLVLIAFHECFAEVGDRNLRQRQLQAHHSGPPPRHVVTHHSPSRAHHSLPQPPPPLSPADIPLYDFKALNSFISNPPPHSDRIVWNQLLSILPNNTRSLQFLHALFFIDSIEHPWLAENSTSPNCDLVSSRPYYTVSLFGGGFCSQFQSLASSFMHALSMGDFHTPVISEGVFRGYSTTGDCSADRTGGRPEEWTCYFHSQSQCHAAMLSDKGRRSRLSTPASLHANAHPPALYSLHTVPRLLRSLGAAFWWGVVQAYIFHAPRPWLRDYLSSRVYTHLWANHVNIDSQTLSQIPRDLQILGNWPLIGIHVRHGDKKDDHWRVYAFDDIMRKLTTSSPVNTQNTQNLCEYVSKPNKRCFVSISTPALPSVNATNDHDDDDRMVMMLYDYRTQIHRLAQYLRIAVFFAQMKKPEVFAVYAKPDLLPAYNNNSNKRKLIVLKKSQQSQSHHHHSTNNNINNNNNNDGSVSGSTAPASNDNRNGNINNKSKIDNKNNSSKIITNNIIDNNNVDVDAYGRISSSSTLEQRMRIYQRMLALIDNIIRRHTQKLGNSLPSLISELSAFITTQRSSEASASSVWWVPAQLLVVSDDPAVITTARSLYGALTFPLGASQSTGDKGMEKTLQEQAQNAQNPQNTTPESKSSAQSPQSLGIPGSSSVALQAGVEVIRDVWALSQCSLGLVGSASSQIYRLAADIGFAQGTVTDEWRLLALDGDRLEEVKRLSDQYGVPLPEKFTPLN